MSPVALYIIALELFFGALIAISAVASGQLNMLIGSGAAVLLAGAVAVNERGERR